MDLTGGFIPLLAGLLCGVLSGFGIGGGSLLILWLTIAAKVSPEQARVLNLLYFLPTAGISVAVHGKNRFLKWSVAIPAALGGMAASLIVLWLIPEADAPWVKKGFGLLLIAAGLRELLARPGARKSEEE